MSKKKIVTKTEKRIGERIQAIRKENGLTQKEFGEYLNYGQSDISSIEKGEKTISYDALLTIAKMFNVSTDYFIKENGIKTDNLDLKFVLDYTGLNEHTIKALSHSDALFLEFINKVVYNYFDEADNEYLEQDYNSLKFHNRYLENIISLEKEVSKLKRKTKELSTYNTDVESEDEILNKMGEAEDIREELLTKEMLLNGLKYDISNRFNNALNSFISERVEDYE